MAIYEKGTLLIPSGPSHDPDRKHLHIICNDTDGNGYNLIVPMASWTNDLCDETCVLLEHDHAFIRTKSWIVYRNAKIEMAIKLERGVQNGLIEPHKDMNANAFLKVKNGICQSPHTKRKIKRYFECL